MFHKISLTFKQKSKGKTLKNTDSKQCYDVKALQNLQDGRLICISISMQVFDR